MLTKEELSVLEAISDQELVLQDILAIMPSSNSPLSMVSLQIILQDLADKGLITRKMGISPYPLYYSCVFYKKVEVNATT
jgi:predicted transcriptional regulator